jgi:hypothetical protein
MPLADFRPNSSGSSVGPDSDLEVNSLNATTTVSAGDALTTSGSLQGGAATIVGENYTVILDEDGIDHSGLVDTPTWEDIFNAAAASNPQAVTPGGKLSVAPAFIQTAGDQAFQMNSANTSIALVFNRDIDEMLSSLSVYIKTISTTGNMNFGLYDTIRAPIADGTTNQNSRSCIPLAMTSNTAPSPLNVAFVDKDNAAVDGTTAYKCFNKLASAGDYCATTSYPDASHPYHLGITIDKARVVNAITMMSVTNSPKDFTIWGSAAGSRPALNSDTDWTLLSTVNQVSWTDGTPYRFAFTNATAYLHYRISITTSTSTGVMYIREIELIEAQYYELPNALLQDLGALDVGSSAGVWLRHTFTGYQLIRGKTYALMATGTAAKDFSVSTRRLNATKGSSIPAGCKVFTSADGKATWLPAFQDVAWQPAMWNIVLNSTTHHSPQLVYGRSKGSTIPLYSGTAWSLATIPATGIFLNCEALTDSQEYMIYLYDVTGTLTLEASTTVPVSQDGKDVMSGTTTKLRLGRFIPLERQTGYQAPIKVSDRMLVANLYNAAPVCIGKGCPYSADTVLNWSLTLPVAAPAWCNIFGSLSKDIDCQIVSEPGALLTAYTIGFGGAADNLALTLDGNMPSGEVVGSSTESSAFLTRNLDQGVHMLDLVSSTANVNNITLCKISARPYARLGITGTLEA